MFNAALRSFLAMPAVRLAQVAVLFAALGMICPAHAQNDQNVLRSFENQAQKQERMSEALRISTRKKHRVLFIMGIALLIAILTTAALGIAQGVYGKPVFVAHMFAAGVSVTLAIIHAIVAIVWFFPF
ncbi:MAG TPA: hypothetical protein VJM76_00610 [Gammaproteobacteria bacterium]|nr:hypothetical protein [Gammaproteobacteria bacterium]